MTDEEKDDQVFNDICKAIGVLIKDEGGKENG